ncbi:MAG: EAL domain-containing protein [Lysobacterales bacterium]
MKLATHEAIYALPPHLREHCEQALARLSQVFADLHPSSPEAHAISDAQQRLQRLLQEIEGLDSRYRSLLDAVPDAVTVHDRMGRIIEANRTAADAYGYDLATLKTLGLLDLNPSLPPDRIDQVWRNHQPGQRFTVTTENVRSDGSRFPVEVHSNLFLDGDQPRVVAIARDISGRLQAESAVRESEQRYRELFDAVDQGVIVQDRRGNVLSANPAAERMLGLSEIAMIRLNFEPRLWLFMRADGSHMPQSELPPYVALRTGRRVDAHVIGAFNPNDRSYSWFTCTALPQFHNHDADPFQVTTVFSDVTELKRQSLLFDEVQRLAMIGGWEADLNSGQMYWSTQIYRLHAVPPEQPMSLEECLRFLLPGDAERMRRAMAATQSSGQPFDLQVRMTDAGGRRHWLRVLGQAQTRMGRTGSIIGVTQDITDRKQVELHLQRQALTDSLTGLPNRDDLVRRLNQAIEQPSDRGGPALLYVDLDRFKVINDLLGHTAGDQLLLAAARRLGQVVGEAGVVARFGGDEFMVLLPSCADPVLPRDLAMAITKAFAAPFPHQSEEFSITASIGIACFPADGRDFQELITHADAAMADAKRRGRNNWQAFTPVLAQTLTDRLLIETQLRRALDNREFSLAFQPQVDLANGQVLAAEALLRWNNRLLGEMPPDRFINHAENTGDIVRIGAWVIREACRQLREWHDQGLRLPRIAVNISYRQFLGEELPETVAAALREFGLVGAALELEMTERVLIEDVPDTLEVFNRLIALGVSLVIDDFGEGYSALNYLRKLPFSGIKISHHFMQGIPGNNADTAICEAIIRIAQSLGINIIAEGVETETQRSFLLHQGTRLAQGYLFARPMSPTQFLDYAQARK